MPAPCLRPVYYYMSVNTCVRALYQIDFEDMVGLAIEALRAHPTPLQHSHILVDEAQDTSEKQLQVLLLGLRHRTHAPHDTSLTSAPPHTCAAAAAAGAARRGRADRGGRRRPDHLRLSRLAPRRAQPSEHPLRPLHPLHHPHSTQVLKRIGEQWGCHAYMLPTNYRCAPRVLDAARALIEGSLVRAQKPPLLAAAVAMGHGGGELRTVAFPDRATELDALGGELQRLQRQQPGRLSGVAVLCRLRAQVDAVSAGPPHPSRTP